MPKEGRVTDDQRLLYRRLGELIESWRKKRCLSQADLGKAIGVDQRSVSNYEKGATVPLHTVVAIEDALSLTRGQLLDAAGYTTPPAETTEQAIMRDAALDRFDKEAVMLLYSALLKRSAD